MKRWIAVVLTPAAVLVMALPASASPSAAASTPVVYAHGTGWHDPARRPTHFFVGAASGPYLRSLSWSYWSAGNAYGEGRLETQNPGCTPAYLCPYHGRWVSVFLRGVRTHGTRLYFRKATVHFYRDGTRRRQHLTFKTVSPATIPMWHGPDKFPWF
jgi:hypothetical protein